MTRKEVTMVNLVMGFLWLVVFAWGVSQAFIPEPFLRFWVFVVIFVVAVKAAKIAVDDESRKKDWLLVPALVLAAIAAGILFTFLLELPPR